MRRGRTGLERKVFLNGMKKKKKKRAKLHPEEGGGVSKKCDPTCCYLEKYEFELLISRKIFLGQLCVCDRDFWTRERDCAICQS